MLLAAAYESSTRRKQLSLVRFCVIIGQQWTSPSRRNILDAALRRLLRRLPWCLTANVLGKKDTFPRRTGYLFKMSILGKMGNFNRLIDDSECC